MQHVLRRVLPLVLGLVPLAAQDARAVEVRLPALAQSRYFRIDPVPGTATPKGGFGLLLVLPGGPGTADFLPWVENGVASQLPADFVTVMLTAPKWTADQAIVWPTTNSQVVGMQYSTEDYVRAVVADVRKAHVIDPARTALLGWSSSGPAVYELLLGETPPCSRAYIAMSVFRQLSRAQQQAAKGARILLDQSPDDRVTKFEYAERAQQQLGECGAAVRLMTYRGGHGWLDAPQARLHEGRRWLLGDEPPPAPLQAVGANLLQNGSFDRDLTSWQVLGNSGTMTASVDRDAAKVGKGCLHLHKTGAMPLDLVAQEVRKLGKAEQLLASCQVKCKGCRNAWVKLFLYDAEDEVVHQDVDLVHLRGDQDWQLVQKSFTVGKASYAVFQVVMVLGGEVWVDDVQLTAAAAAGQPKRK
jgi:hypothetical protein